MLPTRLCSPLIASFLLLWHPHNCIRASRAASPGLCLSLATPWLCWRAQEPFCWAALNSREASAPLLSLTLIAGMDLGFFTSRAEQSLGKESRKQFGYCLEGVWEAFESEDLASRTLGFGERHSERQ